MSTKSGKKIEVETMVKGLEQIIFSQKSLTEEQKITIKQVIDLLGKHDRIKINGTDVILIPDEPVDRTLVSRGISTFYRWRNQSEQMTAMLSEKSEESLDLSKFVSTDEVADYFGVSTQTIRDWIKKGKLSATQPMERGRYYVPREEFEFLVQQREKGKSTTDEVMQELLGEEYEEWEINFEEGS